MTTESQTPIAIFAKVPRPGTVKTRLIPELGAEKTTRLYERCVSHTVKTALDANVGPVELWCTPTILHPFFDGIGRSLHPVLRTQGNGNLGVHVDRDRVPCAPAAPCIDPDLGEVHPGFCRSPDKERDVNSLARAEITDAAMSVRAECVMLNKGPHILEAVGVLTDILERSRKM